MRKFLEAFIINCNSSLKNDDGSLKHIIGLNDKF